MCVLDHSHRVLAPQPILFKTACKPARARQGAGTVRVAMSQHGLLGAYAPPRVSDYGDLVQITAAVHLLMGASDMSDLSFSAPLAPGASGEPGAGNDGAGEVGTITQVVGGSDSSPGSGSGGLPGTGGGGVGSGGGGSGAGGGLPFTGLAAGAVAGVGAGMAAAGAALRRASRRRFHR
jgi:hypothetical protein